MNVFVETWKVLSQKMTPTERAARELAQAELSLLEAQSAVEYAQSVVNYNQTRIKRLKNFISSTNEMPRMSDKSAADN